MDKCIMVGCDLHDQSLVLKIAQGTLPPATRRWANTVSGRQAMIADLQHRASQAGARIVFAYEASGSGFVLWDQLTAAGIECHVLAPNRIERSPRQRKNKCDDRDALLCLDKLRAHVLAGNELPSVWVPPLQTRQDRDLVRHRLSVRMDAADVKRQIRWLLKRNGVESSPARGWTGEYWKWLEDLSAGQLPGGPGQALASMLRQLEFLLDESGRLDKQVTALCRERRYAGVVAALRRNKGVGVLTAMVFLTELGDLSRFENRRKLGNFLGLTPSAHGSGLNDDRKGRITHQGPPRVRRVLCQAVWCRIGTLAAEQESYARLVARNPQHKKKAVVARMRVLAVRMWHDGLEAQRALAAEPQGDARLSHKATGRTRSRRPPQKPPVPYGPDAALGSLASVALSSASAKTA